MTNEEATKIIQESKSEEVLANFQKEYRQLCQEVMNKIRQAEDLIFAEGWDVGMKERAMLICEIARARLNDVEARVSLPHVEAPFFKAYVKKNMVKEI